MLKKINIILISLVLCFSLKLNMGFALIIPVLMFYLLKDSKNMYYTYIPVLITSVLFMRDYFIYILGMLVTITAFYFLITTIVNKKAPKITTFIITFSILCTNLGLDFLLHINDIGVIIVSNGLCALLYLYLERYLYKLILDDSLSFDNSSSSISYLEIMIALVTIVSASTITLLKVNLGFVYAAFFAMYFGRSYKNIYSFIYGICAMLILYLAFKIDEALFVPFICAIYLVPNFLILVLFNFFTIILLFTDTGYESNVLLSMMVVSIVFEIVSPFILEEKKNNQDMFEYIYTQIQKNTNEEILNFALFIDKFSNGFKNPKEFNNRLSEGIKTLVQNHCSTCKKRKECFNKYKIELYGVFKSILLQEPNFHNNYQEFIDYCDKISNFEHTAKFLETKIKAPLTDEAMSQNNIMLAQLNGVSNAIKKYVIDLASKEEISYYQMMEIKTRLENYGYEVTYFEVIKLFKNDFNVKIGIAGKYNDIKETVKLIAATTLKQEVSVIIDNESKERVYINLVPKIKIDITYGYGALSCDGEDICGDNYLIKEINNGHFISAISDGMGKGYRAFYESDMTLKLVEDIIKLNLTSGTALEILNSFYAVQEYLEQYATLDFLEINRYNTTANFYKMGATTTYIFRSNGVVEKIINKSLPFGLDEDITSTTYELKNGDLILMSSDGIFENLIDENKLQDYVQSIKNLPPQRIVYELLNYTINNKIKTKDDMSIIALKIQDAA